MLLTIIFLVVALIAVGVAVSLVVRHWQDIAMLDPSSLKDEQERQRREALILRRFERMRSEKVRPFKRIGRELGQLFDKSYQRLQQRVQTMEALYKTAKQPFTAVAPLTRERIKSLLTEAKSLARDLKWSEAERRYLEALTIDPRHADAYRGLGHMYIKQKLYPQAKETFEFLLRMKKADDATYAGLAEIVESEGRLDEAAALRIKAVNMSPRQPFRHAELAEFWLRHEDPKKALGAAEQAVKFEPTSARYLELSLEAAILVRDRREAERLYDRLRLLTQDSSRFRSWKEKIEAMEEEVAKEEVHKVLGGKG
jgi:tetratricopeptide (TPR) repeat protein